MTVPEARSNITESELKEVLEAMFAAKPKGSPTPKFFYNGTPEEEAEFMDAIQAICSTAKPPSLKELGIKPHRFSL